MGQTLVQSGAKAIISKYSKYFKVGQKLFQSGTIISMTTYNHFYNILRLFGVLPNFPFTTSETMSDYYLQLWYIRVAKRVAERLKT